MSEWKLADAKSQFSAVVDAALGGEPQRVTRRGKPAVVVIGSRSYRNMCQMAVGIVPNFDEPNSDASLDEADPPIAAQDAKRNFSSLVDAAMAGQLRCVTRSDNKAVVVLSDEQYESLEKEIQVNGPSFVDMLLAIPKGGPDDLFDR